MLTSTQGISQNTPSNAVKGIQESKEREIRQLNDKIKTMERDYDELLQKAARDGSEIVNLKKQIESLRAGSEKSNETMEITSTYEEERSHINSNSSRFKRWQGQRKGRKNGNNRRNFNNFNNNYNNNNYNNNNRNRNNNIAKEYNPRRQQNQQNHPSYQYDYYDSYQYHDSYQNQENLRYYITLFSFYKLFDLQGSIPWQLYNKPVWKDLSSLLPKYVPFPHLKCS